MDYFSHGQNQSYIAGYVFGILNVTMIVGPDFVENCSVVIVITFTKFIIGLVTEISTITFFLPIVGFLLMYTIYYK